MRLTERFQSLEERERRLLVVFFIVAAAGAALIPPLALFAIVQSRQGEVEDMREAISAIEDERETLERAKAEQGAIERRYARPAPALAAFLARLASEADVQIPESQDRAVVPHGKRFEERSTKLTLRKVGMLKLVRFLEKIEVSGYPLRVSQINIRKRSSEPDSFDVDMVVSAFDRKPEPKSAKSSRDAGAAEAPGGGESEEKE